MASAGEPPQWAITRAMASDADFGTATHGTRSVRDERRHNAGVDVAELPGRAAAAVPASVTNEAGARVADVRDCLRHDEWQVALDLLADLDWPADAPWWDLLTEVAEALWLADVAARPARTRDGHD